MSLPGESWLGPIRSPFHLRKARMPRTTSVPLGALSVQAGPRRGVAGARVGHSAGLQVCKSKRQRGCPIL